MSKITSGPKHKKMTPDINIKICEALDIDNVSKNISDLSKHKDILHSNIASRHFKYLSVVHKKLHIFDLVKKGAYKSVQSLIKEDMTKPEKEIQKDNTSSTSIRFYSKRTKSFAWF